MTKLSRIFLIISSIVILIGLGTGLYCFASFADCGLLSVKSIDDLSRFEIKDNYVMGKSDEAVTCKHLNEKYELYTTELKKSPVIAVVKPTKKFKQFSGSYMQEIEVIEVLKGKEHLEENTKVSLYNYGGFKFHDEILIDKNMINIMKPDTEYLIFLNPSDLNSYTKEKAYSCGIFSLFSYVCLDRQNCNKVYDPECTDIYSFIDNTYNTTSQKIAESYANVENIIIDEFLGENKS